MHALFFFNDTATTEIYTLSLHDALPICGEELLQQGPSVGLARPVQAEAGPGLGCALDDAGAAVGAVSVAVAPDPAVAGLDERSEEHTSELQSRQSRMPPSARKKKNLQTR